MNSYKVLNNQVFVCGDYSIVPIRYEDRMDIMKWRNEQIYHLRQEKTLTEEDQNTYFDNIVSTLFTQEKPNQILLSYLEGDTCIGYGGLVHINWVDKNAELSFIMDTALESQGFEFHWKTYLKLIEKIAFNELGFHKLYTYAYDIRSHLYEVIEQVGYKKEAILHEHCLFHGEYIDVIIHSKTNFYKLRKATLDDLYITYQWANNPITRKYSFHKDIIPFEDHRNWFKIKTESKDCIYLILENRLKTLLGSIRLDLKGNVGLISYLIDPNYHGRGYGVLIIKYCEAYLKEHHPQINVLEGYVMEENVASINIFYKLKYTKILQENNIKFIKRLYENR